VHPPSELRWRLARELMRQPLSVRDAMALVRDHVDGQVSVYALMAAGALRFEHLLPIGPDTILEWGDGDAAP